MRFRNLTMSSADSTNKMKIIVNKAHQIQKYRCSEWKLLIIYIIKKKIKEKYVKISMLFYLILWISIYSRNKMKIKFMKNLN